MRFVGEKERVRSRVCLSRRREGERREGEGERREGEGGREAHQWLFYQFLVEVGVLLVHLQQSNRFHQISSDQCVLWSL